jgi:anti-sigma factor RsiW
VNKPSFVDELDLHALVDGELDPDKRRKVEDHLLQHPHDAALVESWRRQNAALRAAFDDIATEPAPLSLRGVAQRAEPTPLGQGPIETGAVHWGRPGGSARVRRLDEARRGRSRQGLLSSVLTLAAGAAVAAAGFFAVFGTSRAPTPQTSRPAAVTAMQGFVDRAALSYAAFAQDARPVEIDAARRGELLATLQSRVGFGFAPDLSTLGWRLLGGRVAPGLYAPAGLLFYENAAGVRILLYGERVSGAAAAPAPAARAAVGLAAVEWRATGLAFVLIGAFDAEALLATAERAAADIAAAAPREATPR